MPGVINAFIALLITLGIICVLRPVAYHLGLVDHPGGRKRHCGDVPLIGGIAMFFGFSFALLTLPVSLGNYRSFLAASLLLVVTGLLDDFHELGPKQKLGAQIIAGLLITLWGNAILYNLGNLFFIGKIPLGFLAIPLTIFATLGIVNAINLIDGLDGLAGTLALIELCFFYLIARYTHRIEDLKILLLLMGVIFAFLIFNFPSSRLQRNKIFMGDAGSMFLGLALVWFAIHLSQGTQQAVTPVTMIWIMGVPLLDTFCAIIRRVSDGLSPLSPDHEHFHHVLQRAGFTPMQIVIILAMFSLVMGAIGLIGYYFNFPEGLMFLGFVMVLVMSFFGFSDEIMKKFL